MRVQLPVRLGFGIQIRRIRIFSTGTAVNAVLLCSSAVFLLTGCRPVTAPKPPIATAPPIQVPPSHIGIPITVPMNLPQTAINNAIPQHIDADDYTVSINGGADNCGAGASIGYHVHRGTIALGGAGDTLTAQVDVAYNAIGRGRPKLVLVCGPLFSASCGRGEPEPHLHVGLAVEVGGVNQNWTPNVTFKPASVAPDGACKLTIFNFHVENNVADFARNAINGAANNTQTSVANAIDLPGKANKAWAFMEAPIKLAPSVWLSVHPQQIGIQQFVVTPSQITSGIYLKAMPAISFSDAAPAPDNKPLPPPEAVPASNAYFISVPASADYATINKQLQDALKLNAGGIRYPPTGNNYVTVTDADVYAYGQKAVVRLGLKVHGIFGKKAVLYLVGTPSYDTVRNIISFPDMDFTVESKNILVKIALWLEQNNLRDALRAKASYDISSMVNDAKQQMVSRLNQNIGPVSLNGTVDAINILGVYHDDANNSDKFTADLQTSGTLKVTVQ